MWMDVSVFSIKCNHQAIKWPEDNLESPSPKAISWLEGKSNHTLANCIEFPLLIDQQHSIQVSEWMTDISLLNGFTCVQLGCTCLSTTVRSEFALLMHVNFDHSLDYGNFLGNCESVSQQRGKTLFYGKLGMNIHERFFFSRRIAFELFFENERLNVEWRAKGSFWENDRNVAEFEISFSFKVSVLQCLYFFTQIEN